MTAEANKPSICNDHARRRAETARYGYLRLIVLAAAMVVLLTTCKPVTPSTHMPENRLDWLAGAEHDSWLRGQPARCHRITDSIRRDIGQQALPCSELHTNRETITCANEAFRHARPFALCDSGFGMDSYYENGVAGRADGNVLIYFADTFGPRYRGICLRPDVSLSADDWPRCRTALIDEIDLETGKPYVERATFPNEEAWPQSCAQAALRAPSWTTGVELVKGENPLPDPKKWGLLCRKALPSFELVINRRGRVTCARIISVGPYAPVPGLYDSIRSYLLRWRFKPPTLHGQPIDVRWKMHINPIRRDSTYIPGPPIYPICE